MRKLISGLVCLAFTSNCLGAGATFVKKIASGNTASGTSLNLTVPAGGVAAGNTIIIAFGFNSATLQNPTANDSGKNIYVKNTAFSGSDTWAAYILSAPVRNAMKSGDIITVTFGATLAGWGGAYEFSGILTTGTTITDISKTGAFSSGVTTQNSGAGITTSADLIFAVCGLNNQNATTATAPFITIDNVNSDAGNGDATGVSYNNSLAAGSQTATFTFAATDAMAGYVAFKAGILADISRTGVGEQL